MVVLWDFMGFYGGLMGFYGGLMGFYGGLMGLYGGLMGSNGNYPVVNIHITMERSTIL